MRERKVLVWIAFLVLTAVASWFTWEWLLEYGMLGGTRHTWETLIQDPLAIYVFIDLIALLALASVWVVKDARSLGRIAWIWPPILFTLGTLGLLFYLLLRKPARELRGF